ncbi:MAG: ATP-dependent RNA helicase dbp7 [Alyxoria varia]|nr:MAG: ATP-dependent RNA helicase dbp7 [Alyxoria varia]
MAEDDVLINFNLGSEPFNLQPKFEGGKWRDKLSAKKSAERIRRQSNYSSFPKPASEKRGHSVGSQTIRNGAKRQRLGKESTGQSQTRKEVQATTHDKDTSGQVISSLFTFNPVSSVVQSQQHQDIEPAEPSNAPLKDGLDSFVSLGVSSHIASQLGKMNIRNPTVVQEASIPQLLKEDADAFIQAETGSGKTLAYLLPIVQKIISMSSESDAVHRDSGLFAVIIAPTRELSRQIAIVLDSLLAGFPWLVAGTVIGGEKKKSEKARIRKGLNFLIATPGRLVDHLEHTKVLKFAKVRWLVLDEGDRLMELGFEKDIQKIISSLDGAATVRPAKLPKLPSRRTNILCSATLKTDVQKLGDLSLKSAKHIQAKSKESSGQDEFANMFAAPAQLQQSYAIVPAKLRLVTLAALLKRTFYRKGSVMKAIVFMSCADSVDFHFSIFTRRTEEQSDKASEESDLDELKVKVPEQQATQTQAPSSLISNTSKGVQVFRLHGSLHQSLRTTTLTNFRKSQDPALLICTDVASRGLDVPNVDFVIEYDPPFHRDDHLHRIGRTARAGNSGRATIFLLPGSEEAYAANVLKHGQGQHDASRQTAEDLLQRGFSPTAQHTVGSSGTGNTKNRQREWEEKATDLQLAAERWVLADSTRLELARGAFMSHVRAYATHVATERAMFDIAQLHLGHLAKAFALRDRPSNVNMPGMRSNKSSRQNGGSRRFTRAEPIKFNNTTNSNETEKTPENGLRQQVDNDAARKMKAKMREQHAQTKRKSRGGGADEFNIG